MASFFSCPGLGYSNGEIGLYHGRGVEHISEQEAWLWEGERPPAELRLTIDIPDEYDFRLSF